MIPLNFCSVAEQSISRSRYCWLVIIKTFEKFTWGRDTILAIVLAATSAFIQVRLKLVPEGQKWLNVIATVGPSAALLFTHIVWRMVWSPWRLDSEFRTGVSRAEERIARLKQELESTKTAFGTIPSPDDPQVNIAFSSTPLPVPIQEHPLQVNDPSD